MDMSAGVEGWVGGGPAVGRGGAVVVGDERHHLGHQVLDRAELAPLAQPAGQDREEQLHLVQPGGMAGGVVGVEAGVVHNHQRVSRAMWEAPLSSTRCTCRSAGTLASNSSRKAMKLVAVLRSRSVA